MLPTNPLRRRFGKNSASKGRAGRPTARRLRVEPLEQRHLLSVGPVDDSLIDTGPSADAGVVLASTEETPKSFHEEFRVSVWTEQLIEDLPAWLESQDWPEWMGDKFWVRGTDADGPVQVEELIHMQLRSDPRGGIRTIFTIDGRFSGVTVEQAIADLEALDFVDHVRLESESVIKYGPNAQASIDAITTTHSQDQVTAFGDNAMTPVDVRITFWTQQRVSNVREFVTTQRWPAGVGIADMEELISIPVRSEPRGGYFTIVRLGITGDLGALDRMEGLENARLESESVIQFGPGAQDSVNAISTTHSTDEVYAFGDVSIQPQDPRPLPDVSIQPQDPRPLPDVSIQPQDPEPLPDVSIQSPEIGPLSAESGDLINMDLFRNDSRFDGIDGTGFAVAILDTGIDMDHSYFGDRIEYDYDYVNDDNDASDDNDHGSNVASIAASEDSTNTGMAPGADIIALKVLDDEGLGYYSDIEDALQWVVDHADTYNIASVNMSLGSGNYSQETLFPSAGIYDELESLVDDYGVIVVSASGNSFYTYSSAEGVAYPSADPHSLSIGAVYDDDIGDYEYASGAIAYTTDEDRIAPFSQRDDSLTTVMAPGAAITGADADGGTCTMHGTSQAAPHIAGIAVLAQQLAMQELGQTLTQEQFIELLQYTGDTVNDGDDEDDNVTNTDLDFARVDMLALGEAILDLNWEITADDDPSSAADDDVNDYFVISRVNDAFEVTINGNALAQRDVDSLIRITITGSSDKDVITVNPLGTDFEGNVNLVSQSSDTEDVLNLYDSSGDDTFTADPTEATLEIEDAYTVTATHFSWVRAYADNGGYDVADLYDNEATADTFESYPDVGTGWARLFNTSENFSNKAWTFDFVHARGHDGDKAYLRDVDGKRDNFIAYPDRGWVENNDATGTDYKHKASNFDEVHAYGTVGDSDTARLYDVDDAYDLFVARSYESFFTNPNADYLIRADHYDQVHAYSTPGDNDQATLYDRDHSSETFKGRPNYSNIKNDDENGYDYIATAWYFDRVHGFGTPGDEDKAEFYDNDSFVSSTEMTFTARPGWAQPMAKLEDNTSEEFIRVLEFDQVTATASDSNDTDVALLYDTDDDDTFTTTDNYGQLQYGDYWIRVLYFEDSTATAEDHDDDDTAPLNPLYGWDIDNDWENRV